MWDNGLRYMILHKGTNIKRVIHIYIYIYIYILTTFRCMVLSDFYKGKTPLFWNMLNYKSSHWDIVIR